MKKPFFFRQRSIFLSFFWPRSMCSNRGPVSPLLGIFYTQSESANLGSRIQNTRQKMYEYKCFLFLMPAHLAVCGLNVLNPISGEELYIIDGDGPQVPAPAIGHLLLRWRVQGEAGG